MSTVYPIRCQILNDGSGTTRVDVYDDIGEGGWFAEGLTAKAFSGQMSSVRGPLEVHINSGGGDVFDGIAIANSIRAHKGPVTTVVDGIAASIASVIAQAGQERVMRPGSMMMIHDAFGMTVGNAAEMAKMAETLDQVSGNIAAIYADRCGGTPDTWRGAMKDESWYTADEAVAAGLADRTGSEPAELPVGLDLAAFTAVPGRIAARLRSLPQAHAPAAAAAAGETCKTCDGAKRLPHPGTGKPGMKCPGCDGTGTYAPGDDDDDQDGGEDGPQDRSGRVYGRDGRLLGLETMPLADKALPVHHTAVTGAAWDGPAAVAAMPNDDTVLEYCFAWQSDAAASVPHRENDDDADDQKQSYKFPHHTGKGAAANLAACRNGLARLSGADIPDADRAGVEAHLRAHLDDGGGDSTSAAGAAERYRAALKGATA